MFKWLGWKDSNFRMLESESRALPLGDTPINEKYYIAESIKRKEGILKK